jgi:hypothetical protein
MGKTEERIAARILGERLGKMAVRIKTDLVHEAFVTCKALEVIDPELPKICHEALAETSKEKLPIVGGE